MSIDVQTILGRNIKLYRTKFGWNKNEFSEKIGIQPQAVSAIESGKSFVKSKTLNKICEVFNISPRTLFSDILFLDNENHNEIINKISNMLYENDLKNLKFIYNFIKEFNDFNINDNG